MRVDENNTTTPKGSKISFHEFWTMISGELGETRLLLNPNATNLREFISERSDICGYLHRAIKLSFRQSGCKNLHSPISIESVLDILGETAHRLQREKHGDLFDVELLEEIAWLISDRYPDQVRQLLAQCENRLHNNNTTRQNRGQLLSFPDYKIRRANHNQ